MEMDFEFLDKEQGLIETGMMEIGDTETKGPIFDGVMDVGKYLNAKFRICWVLKEAYENGDGSGEGGWPLGAYLLDLNRMPWKHPTWKMVIYVSYSLLHDFMPYSELDYIDDDPQMAQCLGEIAVVNVGKMPASTTSTDAGIAAKYEFWKPILHRQLRSYDPQIIIFGNTFQHFQQDLGISEEELIPYGIKKPPMRYAVKDGKLYIGAYHPSQMKISWNDYAQGIIDVVAENATLFADRCNGS